MTSPLAVHSVESLLRRVMARCVPAAAENGHGQRWLEGLACTAVALSCAAGLWLVLLSDMQRERAGLQQRLATMVTPVAAAGEGAPVLEALQRDIAERQARWLRDESPARWMERVQLGVQRETDLHLEQLRAVRETPVGPAGQHPAQAATLRLTGPFDALMRWIGGYAKDATAVALQPLRLTGLPDGSVRVEAQALAFLGIPARGAAASSGAALGPLVAMSAGSAGPLAAIPAPFAGTSETLPTPARNLFDQKSLATALGLPRAAPAARSGGGPDLSRRREPLEAHDLRDLRVVGVLQSEQQRIAIVEAAGAHHSVSAGQYLGRRHGRVQHISDGGLELVEWQQHAGHWRRVTVRLRIDTPATRGPGHPAGDVLDE